MLHRLCKPLSNVPNNSKLLLLLLLLQERASWAFPPLLGVPCCARLAGLGPCAD
jgi:hypothetical protein